MITSIERQTMKKVYLHLLPFCFVLYFICYLDRVNIGFAALTVNKDLGLSSYVFGLGAGAFFWLKAIDTTSSAASAKTLLFLLHLKLIDDPTGHIAALKHDPQNAPFLGSGAVPATPSATAKFFAGYRIEFGEISQAQMENITQLFRFIEKDTSLRVIAQVAYVLATVKFESTDSFAPRKESCINCTYAPYVGRGYVQLAFETNYKKASDLLGLTGTDDDLVKFPDRVLDPQIAYRVTSLLMREGFATGKKLSDYINEKQVDYVNARRTVNGLDHAQLIASYADRFQKLLEHSLSAQKVD